MKFVDGTFKRIMTIEEALDVKETLSDKVQAAQDEIAGMYAAYELAVRNGDDFREYAMNTWSSLELQIDTGASDDVLDVYHRRVQSITALAVMEYARAAAIKP